MTVPEKSKQFNTEEKSFDSLAFITNTTYRVNFLRNQLISYPDIK